MRNKKFCLFICVILGLHKLNAQEKSDYKFGKLTAADFNLTAEKFDSGANALIIADVGNTSFEGNDQANFTLVFTRFLRVKIINKAGFDIGDREILLYHNDNGDAEKIITLKGSTFNLENGAISETKLDDKSIYNDKYTRELYRKKFSMPALKVGAIYDLQYTIKSPFHRELRSWQFQGEYPCLWSEYEVTIAPPYHYAMKMKGDQHFDINVSKEVDKTYSLRELNGIAQTNLYSYTGAAFYRRWVKKNVPALHEEPYTTTLENYNTKVSFQLNYVQWHKESEKHEYMTTWNNTSKELLEDESFGQALNRENMWMSDELKSVIAGADSQEEITLRVFNFIHDNFNSIDKGGYSKNGLFVISSLKEAFKSRQGNVAEINLLLTAMLRKAGIRADPLILSTRDHGIANPDYPHINEYNYVICIAYPGEKQVTLDASQPFNAFGDLPEDCYNGWGHVINEESPLSMNFSADSVKETNLTNVIIVNDEKGNISGAYKEVMGKSESYDVRREIKNSSVEKYERKTATINGSDYKMENFGIDSLKNYEFPLTIHYDFELKSLASKADVLYFNPMLYETFRTNPFKSMDRHYPVEIPYQIDETYILNMDIPAGYQVDELPKSARVNYNGKEGLFEYLIQKGQENLQMRVRLKLNKAFFPVEEYGTLRDFFADVVKKEGEQIVFKKIH